MTNRLKVLSGDRKSRLEGNLGNGMRQQLTAYFEPLHGKAPMVASASGIDCDLPTLDSPRKMKLYNIKKFQKKIKTIY